MEEPKHIQKAREWAAHGYTEVHVEHQMKEEGFDEAAISEACKWVAKYRSEQQRNRGFVVSGLGAMILVGSMLTSLGLEFGNPMFDYILYGVTGVGAILLMAGMIMVVGF